MANEQNLRPMRQSSEEARENGRKGGKRSGEVKRQQKMMREICLQMLNGKLPEETAEQMRIFGLSKGCLTWGAAIIAKQINKAVKGDVQSAKFLLETSGQKEADKVELSGGLNNRQEIVVAKDQMTADLYNKLMEGDDGE